MKCFMKQYYGSDSGAHMYEGFHCNQKLQKANKLIFFFLLLVR